MRDLLQFARPFLTPIDWTNPVTDDELNDGLLSRYLADMSQWGSLTWRDLTDRYHGALTSMEPATDWVTAQERPGGMAALDFASNDYVNTNHTFDEISDADRVTLSAWVNNPLSGNHYIGGMKTAGNDGIQFGIWGDTAGDPLLLTVSGGFDQFSDATGMSVNTWHHVAVTYDQANVVFYIDGQQLSSHAQTAAIDVSSEPFFLGANNNAGSPQAWFNGLLDDICIYDRALPGSKIAELYEDSRLGSPRTVNRSAWLVPARVIAPVGGATVPLMMSLYKNAGAL